MRRRDLLVGAIAGTLVSIAALGGSASAAVDTYERVAAATGTEPVRLQIFLPLRDRDGLDRLLAAQADKASPLYHKWLTPAEFKERFAASAADFATAKAFFARAGFGLVKESAQGFEIAGTAASAAKAFGTTLSLQRNEAGRTRIQADGRVVMPAAMEALGVQVVGLKEKRVPMQTMSHRRDAKPLVVGKGPNARFHIEGGYWYNDLKQAYHYPAFNLQATQDSTGSTVTMTGAGANMGVVISSDVLDSDIAAYFTLGSEGHLAPPTLNRRPVTAAAPAFDDESDDSFEASLDVQMTMGSAPGASDTIYIIDDLSDASILAGYVSVEDDNTVDVVNSSFGECDLYYAKRYNGGVDYRGILGVYDAVFAQGNSQGITFVASSGDEGGAACAPLAYFTASGKQNFDAIPGASTPATSPHVTGVGGTDLVTAYSSTSLNSSYVSENAKGDKLVPTYDPYGTGNYLTNVYWGSGGGLSDYYTMPAYQALVGTGNTVMRSSPDISMHMGGCPGGIALPCHANDSFVIEAFGVGQKNGGWVGAIGTSASSPEFVGVVALLVEKTGGRVGNVNPYIYNLAQAQNAAGTPPTAPFGKIVFEHNIQGWNGFWISNPTLTYNHVIGNGTPMVSNFLGLPAPAPSDLARYPTTVSNP